MRGFEGETAGDSGAGTPGRTTHSGGGRPAAPLRRAWATLAARGARGGGGPGRAWGGAARPVVAVVVVAAVLVAAVVFGAMAAGALPGGDDAAGGGTTMGGATAGGAGAGDAAAAWPGVAEMPQVGAAGGFAGGAPLAAADAGAGVDGEAEESGFTSASAAARGAGAPPLGALAGELSAGGLLGGLHIARRAEIDLRVEAVPDAFEAVRAAAVRRGGFVADSWFTGAGAEARAALTVRVPTAAVDTLLADLRGLAAEVASVQTGTQDLTGQVVDVEARLRSLAAVELRYIELLGEARDIGEILVVQDRLDGVRGEIERLTAQREVLADRTALATVHVGLGPVVAPAAASDGDGSGPVGAAADAWAASLDTLRAVATGVVTVLVFSWWLLPPAVAGAWVMRRRSHRRTAAPAAAEGGGAR